MNRALILLSVLAFALAGCGSMPKVPNVPKVATVTVTEYRTLPDWLIQTLPVRERLNGAVGEFVLSENANTAALRLANCRFLLLQRLSAGEEVRKDECVPK